jgi:hypothetical protein
MKLAFFLLLLTQGLYENVLAADACQRCIGNVGSFEGRWRDDTYAAPVFPGYPVKSDSAFLLDLQSVPVEKARISVIFGRDKPFEIVCAKEIKLCEAGTPLHVITRTKIDLSLFRAGANAKLNDKDLAKLFAVAASRSGLSVAREAFLCIDCGPGDLDLSSAIPSAVPGVRYRLCPGGTRGERLCDEPPIAIDFCDPAPRCKGNLPSSGLHWILPYRLANGLYRRIDGGESMVLLVSRSNWNHLAPALGKEVSRLQVDFKDDAQQAAYRTIYRAMLLTAAEELNAHSPPKP